ncbi:response regulator [Nakamurella deserti]|uniref:response regulator n=1 Tax=Nakamurella deserti TaxID=2164074 RepID=UPI001300B4BB|nr:response regulator [Nakamurella deserti]
MSTVVNVLVVADDRTAARAEAALVNRLPGFRATATVGSAAAGLRRLAKGDVHLVLLDRRLPDADGVELAARLREQGFRGDVLLTTAAADRVAAAGPLPAGVAGELVRPFSFELVRDVLQSWAAERAPIDDTGPVPTRRSRAARSGLPLGMRPDTLDAITVVVRECCAPPADEVPGLSASAVASAIGASRLTVRRYLDYLADAGVLARSLRHRSAGRPEALYRPVAQAG